MDRNTSPAGASAPPVPAAGASAPPNSYEDALAELDALVASMEAGNLPLDRMLESYRRGAELLTYCRARLDAVEEQVRILEEGHLKPWSPA
jgi:exodeoxyribonuclease VII small subunit